MPLCAFSFEELHNIKITKIDKNKQLFKGHHLAIMDMLWSMCDAAISAAFNLWMPRLKSSPGHK